MAKCEYCGKGFITKSSKKKYCSRECKLMAFQLKRQQNEQLCWSCQKACGRCSWSKNLTPVKGWEATPVMVKDDEGNIRTYHITSCPEYIHD